MHPKLQKGEIGHKRVNDNAYWVRASFSKKWVLGHPQGVSLLKIDFSLPLLLQSFQLQVLKIETIICVVNK